MLTCHPQENRVRKIYFLFFLGAAAAPPMGPFLLTFLGSTFFLVMRLPATFLTAAVLRSALRLFLAAERFLAVCRSNPAKAAKLYAGFVAFRREEALDARMEERAMEIGAHLAWRGWLVLPCLLSFVCCCASSTRWRDSERAHVCA